MRFVTWTTENGPEPCETLAATTGTSPRMGAGGEEGLAEGSPPSLAESTSIRLWNPIARVD